MTSWMLARLKRETALLQTVADADRMAVIRAATRERYRDYLVRIFGFEAPVEATLVMTPGLDEVMDLRSRAHVRLLKADLRALGVANPSELPQCRPIYPFRTVAEALGWIYSIEHNALVHGQVLRHLERQLPREVAIAGAYLSGGERALGARLRELGEALDGFARDTDTIAQIVEAARKGFRRQHGWFAQAVPPTRHTTQVA